MPFLAPVFGAIGSAFGALGITAKTLISIVLNVAMSLLQMLMQRQPKPDDIRQVIRQSLPVRMVHLGKVRTGGPMLFIEVSKRIVYIIQYFGQGPCARIDEFFIDDRPATRDKKGWVNSPPYDYEDGDIVRVFFRMGNRRSSSYRLLRTVFAGYVNTRWRGDRMVTSLLRARSVRNDKIAKFYPNRLPTLNILARFGNCYNPLKGSRQYSESLPLQMLEYLTHEDGLQIPRELIDLDDFGREHRFASELLETKAGGSVRRYYGSTTWKLDEEPRAVINRLNLAMDGRLFLKPTGKIGFQVGRWIEPRVHIPNDKIIDAEFRDSAPPVQEANEIVIKWTNPESRYSEAMSDPWRNLRALRRAGGVLRNATFECYGIQNHNHARRIAKILDQKLNPKWHGTLRTTLWGMQAWDERFITIDYDDFGISGEVFEIQQISLDEESMTVIMEVAHVERTLYDFNAQQDEGTAPINPESIGEGSVPTPQNFRAVVNYERVQEIINNRAEKVKRLTLELSVDVPKQNRDQDKRVNDDDDNSEVDDDDDDGDPSARSGPSSGPDSKVKTKTGKEDEDDLECEFQISRANRDTWRPIGGLGENFKVETGSIVDGAKYDARVRFRTGEGAPGDWVMIEDIVAIGDTKPPRVPIRIRARRTGPNEVTVTCHARDDDNFAAVELWRDNDKSAARSNLITTVYGAQNSTITLVDTNAPKGNRYYFVRSINFSGVGGARKPATNNPIRL